MSVHGFFVILVFFGCTFEVLASPIGSNVLSFNSPRNSSKSEVTDDVSTRVNQLKTKIDQEKNEKLEIFHEHTNPSLTSTNEDLISRRNVINEHSFQGSTTSRVGAKPETDTQPSGIPTTSIVGGKRGVQLRDTATTTRLYVDKISPHEIGNLSLKDHMNTVKREGEENSSNDYPPELSSISATDVFSVNTTIDNSPDNKRAELGDFHSATNTSSKYIDENSSVDQNTRKETLDITSPNHTSIHQLKSEYGSSRNISNEDPEGTTPNSTVIALDTAAKRSIISKSNSIIDESNSSGKTSENSTSGSRTDDKTLSSKMTEFSTDGSSKTENSTDQSQSSTDENSSSSITSMSSTEHMSNVITDSSATDDSSTNMTETPTEHPTNEITEESTSDTEPATENPTNETTEEYTSDTEPATDPSNETTEEYTSDTEPATDPSNETTEESTSDTEPATDPTNETTEESTSDTEPATDPTNETTEESTSDTELVTDPTNETTEDFTSTTEISTENSTFETTENSTTIGTSTSTEPSTNGTAQSSTPDSTTSSTTTESSTTTGNSTSTEHSTNGSPQSTTTTSTTTSSTTESSTVHTTTTTGAPPEDKDVAVEIVAGILGVLLLGGLLATGAVMYRRGKLPWNIRNSNASVRPHPISLSRFESHCDQLLETPGRLGSEFQLLQTLSGDIVDTHTFNAAQLPDNRRKNRYINILPYDLTRVKLEVTPDEPSDYINASYVKGYSNEVEYIASQGPKEETLDDFWRMIYTQNVRVIAMVTNFEENGKVKCEPYLPKLREQMVAGDIIIKCSTELHFTMYTKRTLVLSMNDKNRDITHLHFNEWPDFGCPEGTDSMLHFCGTLRFSMTANSPGLALVHCSAGVGRTGTLIALDILLQHIQENKKVDIFGTVYKLRKQRTNMVQTEGQYGYIYKCVKDALQDPSSFKDCSPSNSMEPIYENIPTKLTTFSYEKVPNIKAKVNSSESECEL